MTRYNRLVCILEDEGLLPDEWEFLTWQQKCVAVAEWVQSWPWEACYYLHKGFEFVAGYFWDVHRARRFYWPFKGWRYRKQQQEDAQPMSAQQFDALVEQLKVEPALGSQEWHEKYNWMIREHRYCPIPRQGDLMLTDYRSEEFDKPPRTWRER